MECAPRMEFVVGHIVELTVDLPCPNGFLPLLAGARGMLTKYYEKEGLWAVHFGTGGERFASSSHFKFAQDTRPAHTDLFENIRVFLEPYDFLLQHTDIKPNEFGQTVLTITAIKPVRALSDIKQ
jgi:hypothetical protein